MGMESFSGDRTRRTFLKTTGAAAGGLLAMGTASASSTSTFDGYSGIVSTRDDFDINWLGCVERTDGTTKTGYDTLGTIPGLDGSSPDELVIFVHGWAHDVDRARKKFRLVSDALRQNGVETPEIGYSWDSDTATLEFWQAVEIASRNGWKLATFLEKLHRQSPGTDVRIIAHSLGAEVAAEAHEIMHEHDFNAKTTSLSFVGGAIDNDSVSLGGEYGQGLAHKVEQVDNFWKSDDQTLGIEYVAAMWDRAVGETGAEGETPDNYTDINVDYVTEHDAYPKPDVGCMPDVVSRW